jgi:hypothetical protein
VLVAGGGVGGDGATVSEAGGGDAGTVGASGSGEAGSVSAGGGGTLGAPLPMVNTWIELLENKQEDERTYLVSRSIARSLD